MKTYETTIFIKGIECEVEYEASYCPEKVSGPMDQCHPDESELTVLSCTITDNNQSIDVLSKEEIDAACWEDFMGRLYPDDMYEPDEED